MDELKQAIAAIGIIAVAAGILAATVLYSISFLRQCERRILTGELDAVQQVLWLQQE